VTAIGLGATAAATVAGAVVGGVAGAGLGAVLAGAVIRRRAEQAKEQLAEGGMVLVSVGDADAERGALQILRKAGARDIPVHEFEREWTLKDRPFSEVQFDPFLWWPGDRGQE
jgi:hypothetical protein